ncbi:MAG TPA: hypothetical protein EYG03_01450 [Planctomycetes bacterium]|nr:hypothetical protein [Planctomycetota bacterium]
MPFDVVTLWHNSFDDFIDNDADEIAGRLKKAAKAASTGASFPADMPIKKHTAMVLASVNQGRNLRNAAKKLGLTVNEKFDNLVMVPNGKRSKKVNLGNSLSFTVIGPREERVTKLQQEWDKQIKKKGLAKTAEFADKSVFNLASIIVVAKCGGKTMLLTGDARGDDIEAGLKTARISKRGKAHFDLLKMPHHGSDNNVTTDFFRNITADHYVVSGNGKHGNPEIATFQMLSQARGSDKFTLYVTNEEPRLKKFFASEKRNGKNYTVKFRKANAKSISCRSSGSGSLS